jgi:hypothetical protein
MGDGERGQPELETPGAGGSDQPELETLQQKVQYMIAKTFPGQKVSGRFFADLVKARGGALSHSYFSDIVRGEKTEVSEDILRALGLGFGCDWRFFKPESEVVDEVVAHLDFLARKASGEITGVAGRGISGQGLTPELLQYAMALVDEAKKRQQGRSEESKP